MPPADTTIFSQLSGQTEDPGVFLRQHPSELCRLASFPGAADRRLDFGCHYRDLVLLARPWLVRAAFAIPRLALPPLLPLPLRPAVVQ